MSELDLLPFRLLIDRAAEPVRRHFRALFWPVALPLVAASVVWSLFHVAFLTNLGSFPEGGGFPHPLLIAGWIIASFGMMLVYFLAFGAVMVGAMDIVHGRKVDIRRAWLFILEPQVFLTMFVVGILSMVSVAMCVLPSLYVIPILSFVLPVLIEERIHGFDALRRSVDLANFNRSRKLMDYPWVQVSVLTLIGWVVLYALTLCVQMPFLVAQQVLVIRDLIGGGEVADLQAALGQQAWLQVPANVAAAIATTIGWLYLAFAMAYLYAEVRRRREGRDLELAVESLEQRQFGLAAGDSSVEPT